MDRPIEYPPAKGMLSEESKALMYAFTPEVRALNADYPYWDKMKYHRSEIDPRILWQALKLLRSLGRTPLHFGRYAFSYNRTDEMLSLLHTFDMHVGGASPAATWTYCLR